ncbi:MAG: hypothetical protein HY360_20255 [Verrucomicrobia bacterium]|nr:hypothetical protein [Verrucomicrobiota bacterium]
MIWLFEIKLSKTLDCAMADGLKRSRQDLGFTQGSVLTLQDTGQPIAADIAAANWCGGLEDLLAPT